MILISSEKLGYIVLYLKIGGPANFAFLAIRKICKFSKKYTPLWIELDEVETILN